MTIRTITRSGITALSVAVLIVLKVSMVLIFFRTNRTVMTIKTITRSGITVVRGRRNCLKGLNGLNQQQKKISEKIWFIL